MTELLSWLQTHYLAQCNGDWEHSYGFKIDTLDNPGWTISFDLIDTDMENVPFEKIEHHRSDRDWVVCMVDDRVFKGAGGPSNLIELLAVFREWVEATPRSA